MGRESNGDVIFYFYIRRSEKQYLAKTAQNDVRRPEVAMHGNCRYF